MGTNRKRKIRLVKQLLLLAVLIISIAAALQLYIRWYNSGLTLCGEFQIQSDQPSTKKSPELCFEIAETNGKRAKGLMFRKSQDLPERSGMLFIYPNEDLRSFWMKNTFTALDMIFMDSNMSVVGIVENAAPLTETPRRVDKPAQFILELHAGSASKWGIQVGSKLEVRGKLPLAEN